MPVQEFSQKLGEFFMRQWATLMPPDFPAGVDISFLVGGYDEGEPYGRLFEVHVPSRPIPNEVFAGVGQFGMLWGGQSEYVDRLTQGFDGRLPQLVQASLGLDDAGRDRLREHLKANLNLPIPYPFLPLQDCVDLTIFLIRTTMTLQKWVVGIRGVGGAIDVATITRIGGFRPIQQKTVTGENVHV